MGVIKRQGLKNTIVSYAGVGLAALSTIFIYPNDRETYGLAQFLIGTGMFLLPIMCFGANSVMVRFFPRFRDDEKEHNGILGLTMIMSLAGCGLFFILYWLFEEKIFELYSNKPPEFQVLLHDYLPYLIPLACLITFFHLFYYYSANFGRITIPVIFQNSIKVTLPVLIFLHYNDWIGLDIVIKGVLVTYIGINTGMLLYIASLGQWYWKPQFSFLDKQLVREIRNFALYGMLLTMGSALSFRIDSFMIPTLIDFTDNGTYSISLFIGNAIAIPSTALIMIAAPIISDAFQKKDLKHIAFIYKESSISLFLVGLYLFCGVLICVEDLFSIMPKGEEMKDGLLVVVFIGLAKLIDMVTSVNNQIINYSEKYRFGMYAIIILAICNILMNLWLIPIYGIIGAAIATLASITLYNASKLVYIYMNWEMQPFSWATLKAMVVAALISLPIYYLPLPDNPVISILLKGALLSIIFIPTIYYLQLSKDLNDMMEKGLQKIFPKK